MVAASHNGLPSRFADPARFLFAHGGKDGHPSPVPLKTYDESLNSLRISLDAAKLGSRDKLDGFRHLERFEGGSLLCQGPKANKTIGHYPRKGKLSVAGRPFCLRRQTQAAFPFLISVPLRLGSTRLDITSGSRLPGC